MSRYCFYCGKELKPGERCTCRYAQKINDQKTTETEEPSEYNHTSEASGSFWERFKKQRSQNRRYAENTGARYQQSYSSPFQQWGTRSRNRGRTNLRTQFRNIIEKIWLLLSNPIQGINQLVHSSLGWLIANIAVSCLLFTTMTMRSVGHSNLGNLLVFAAVRPNAEFNLTTLIILVTLICILLTFSMVLIRIITYRLTVQFIGQLHYPMTSFFKAVIPGLIYFNIFMVIGHLTAGGSGVTTIFLVSSGISVQLIVDYISLREISGQPDGEMLKQVSIAILLQCLIAGLLINLTFPNISNFGFIPIT